MIALIFRYYSYVFHGLLGLFLVAVSGIALATRPESLKLEVLPWSGSTLTYVVFFGGLFGLLSVALAFLRKLPILLVLWSLVVFVLLVKGFVFSGYGFAPGDLTFALEMIGGALLALIGPWIQLRAPKK